MKTSDFDYDLPESCIGRLPGDIRIEGKNGSFYFPIVSSLLLSAVLTILLNILGRFLRK